MIERCCRYLSVRCMSQYVTFMSRTCFKVNLHSRVAWIWKNPLLKTIAISVVYPYARCEGGGAQRSPYQFSPLTSTNVGSISLNFVTFIFNPFATMVQNFEAVPTARPRLLDLNQDNPSKKVGFLDKSL